MKPKVRCVLSPVSRNEKIEGLVVVQNTNATRNITLEDLLRITKNESINNIFPTVRHEVDVLLDLNNPKTSILRKAYLLSWQMTIPLYGPHNTYEIVISLKRDEYVDIFTLTGFVLALEEMYKDSYAKATFSITAIKQTRVFKEELNNVQDVEIVEEIEQKEIKLLEYKGGDK